jgi:hypothetical protein
MLTERKKMLPVAALPSAETLMREMGVEGFLGR